MIALMAFTVLLVYLIVAWVVISWRIFQFPDKSLFRKLAAPSAAAYRLAA